MRTILKSLPAAGLSTWLTASFAKLADLAAYLLTLKNIT
jgi:hypothetical protein